MKEPCIAIFAAVAMESNAIAAGLGLRVPHHGLPSVGAIGEVSVRLHLVGIGGQRVDEIVFDEKPRWVVMAGFAGALDPALKVGDVVISGCRESLAGRLKCVSGRVHTSAQIVSTPVQKAELFASTGACAVDMEGTTVEQWARRQNIPYIAVRAISDSAGDELDPRMLSLVDQWGRPRVGAVVAYLVRNPSRIKPLLQLRRASRIAGARLGAAVLDMVRALGADSRGNSADAR